jgi:hypothetical protein
LLQLGGLVRAAAGDQGERRPKGANGGDLLLADLGRHEAEDADAPGVVA